jgi:hypothetical protein
VGRAEYLLQLAGGPSAADDKSVPGELLGEVMMLREEIEEAIEADDKAALEQNREAILARQRQTIETIATMCRGGNLKDPATQKQLRQQLNTVKYWNNLLDRLPTREEA